MNRRSIFHINYFQKKKNEFQTLRISIGAIQRQIVKKIVAIGQDEVLFRQENEWVQTCIVSLAEIKK